MSGVAFLIALLFLALAFLLNRFKKRQPKPHVHFSSLKDFKGNSGSWRGWLEKCLPYLFYGALASFLLAFVDPHFFLPKKGAQENPNNNPTEGIAIYLALDQSGSMSEQVAFSRTKQTKIDLVKQVTSQFVKDRPNDLLGLIFFARTAQVVAPLTLDHAAILKDLKTFDNVKNEEQDGTAIGYAIYKGANLIAATRHYAESLNSKEQAAYTIKNAILVVVTDGLQDPNKLDEGNRLRFMSLQEAAQFAKDQKVKVYIINVDPTFSTDQYEPHRRLMKRITELTGGNFYLVDNVNNLEAIFADINQLEKSKLPEGVLGKAIPKEEQPHLYKKIAFYPYFIGLGLLLLALSLFLQTVVLRRVP